MPGIVDYRLHMKKFISRWNKDRCMCMYNRGFTKFVIKVLWRLKVLEQLRTLIEVFLSLPCWLSQWAFWNFKCKVLKYFRTCNFHNTLIPSLYIVLLYRVSHLKVYFLKPLIESPNQAKYLDRIFLWPHHSPLKSAVQMRSLYSVSNDHSHYIIW